MKITSISASRQKTFDKCTYKYLLTYCLFICNDCSNTFYDVEIIQDKKCPYCKSDKTNKVSMKSNWGAAHGTALHWVLEEYANGHRGFGEDKVPFSKEEIKNKLDWKNNINEVYKRGASFQPDKTYSILDIAKEKEYHVIEKNCNSCSLFLAKDSICSITNEKVDTMPGCPKPLYNGSIELMTEFLQRMDEVYKTKPILGVEAEFVIDLEQKDIHGTTMNALGFMDFIYEVDKDTIEMVDYKAGAFIQKYDEVYNDIQARMYSVALRHLYPGYQNYLLTFDYMRGQPVTVTYTKDDDDVTKNKLIDKWKQIAAPQNISRNIGWWCKAMCDKQLCDKEWPKFVSKFKKRV